MKYSILFGFFLALFMTPGCEKVSELSSPERAPQSANKKLPKLLDLGAHKCIPCQKMAPMLKEITTEFNGEFEVEFVDVWQPENRERAMTHGVQSIPTQIFFDSEGKELARHVGYFSREDILGKWRELGYVFPTPKSKSEK